MKRKFHELKRENTLYKELYQWLRTKPENEAWEVLKRIQAADDPREVWSPLKDAELLFSLKFSGSATKEDVNQKADGD